MQIRKTVQVSLLSLSISFIWGTTHAGEAIVPPPRVKVHGARTVLGAKDAKVTGGIRLVGPSTNALGRWRNTSDKVSWHIDVGDAGAVDLSITYACPPGSGGAEFEVVCGDAKAGGVVFETGEATFITVPLGLLWLPEGASEITVRAIRKPGAAVMSLRELVLETGFQSLFDGKSLDGWHGKRTKEGKRSKVRGYQAIDGILTCMPGGNIYTEQEYSDFVFRFEFRLQRGSNNGVGIRTPDSGDAAYRGMEIQIIDNTAPVFRTIKPWQRHGSIYHLFPAKTGYLRPVGQWNTEEIIANGRRVTVNLNGVTIVDANLDDIRDPKLLKAHPGIARTSGYIGFLGHGSKVEFRDIRIRELTKK